MSLTGLRNMRMFDSSECMTPLLTEDDWEEGSCCSETGLSLAPITRQEKLYFVEMSKLALLGKT